MGSTAVGNGVAVSEVAQQFAQGNIETTGNKLDLAISGNGFFILSNNGALNYTRDGEFQLNSDGEVVNSPGPGAAGVSAARQRRLQYRRPVGHLAHDGREPARRRPRPRPITANLPANATAPPDAPFSPTDPNSYNNTTSLTVYDSLGAAHTASLYFIKGAAAE